jgi:hypothetical protein
MASGIRSASQSGNGIQATKGTKVAHASCHSDDSDIRAHRLLQPVLGRHCGIARRTLGDTAFGCGKCRHHPCYVNFANLQPRFAAEAVLDSLLLELLVRGLVSGEETVEFYAHANVSF